MSDVHHRHHTFSTTYLNSPCGRLPVPTEVSRKFISLPREPPNCSPVSAYTAGFFLNFNPDPAGNTVGHSCFRPAFMQNSTLNWQCQSTEENSIHREKPIIILSWCFTGLLIEEMYHGFTPLNLAAIYKETRKHRQLYQLIHAMYNYWIGPIHFFHGSFELPNNVWFSKFICCQTRHYNKDLTAPWMCCYTTSWNIWYLPYLSIYGVYRVLEATLHSLYHVNQYILLLLS